MKVYFIGAGPGDPELLTLKAHKIISKIDLCLYAGSLVPREILSVAPKKATLVDTSNLNLIEIQDYIIKAKEKDFNVARIHSGDVSVYGALSEQMNMLDQLNIEYEIIPGIPAYVEAAALLKTELTSPGQVQSVILTRTSFSSTPMPEGEDLVTFAKTGATLVIHLSIRRMKHITRELSPVIGGDAIVAVLYRIGWPDQLVIVDRLDNIAIKVRENKITRTALIITGKNFKKKSQINSVLYDSHHNHLFRPK
ncbi:MAG: precorrin-4 C(11)-methyltransferase [Hyphomicrobiales bacterium]|jgi:precorrin-4/cobalt-precorrin-4 C11-methyltransferase|nr:precorrin-4 C(11)-methyltransferase [Hyphomicrobiales bacterium]